MQKVNSKKKKKIKKERKKESASHPFTSKVETQAIMG